MAEDNVETVQEAVKPAEEQKEKAPVEEPKEAKEVKEAEKPVEEEKAEDASPELLKKIRNQIEFYFGDVNMHRDKFLVEQVKLDEGWVPLTVMLNFKILASLTSNISVIIQSLEDSELMEISEDKKKIRRSPKHPLPAYNEEYRKAQEERTVYAKGFPQTDIDIQKLKAYLEPYDPIENVIMRKYKNNKDQHCFKGSIFIQFKTLEGAKSFMALESVKYKETELIRKWSKDHAAEKSKEKEEFRQKKEEKKKSNESETKKNNKEEEKEEKKSFQFPKGTIIHMTDLSESCLREDIKKELEGLEACVVYVDYSKGEPQAWVRLQSADSAKPIVDKMQDSKLKINDKEVTCRVLEGDEETEYLEKVEKQITGLRNERNKKNWRGGKRGRGGRKRGYSPQRDGSSKKIRT